MAILKSGPPEPVRSLDEMFAIAHAMEHEAATRYAELGEQARRNGMPELADVFEDLAREERGHEAQVSGWSQKQSGKPPDWAHIKWDLPETFDAEMAGELAGSRIASAYRILSMAVRNEERAFAFWSYVAAEARDPEVREAAERMAREELGHVALLRRERRKAYHAERTTAQPVAARSVAERMAEVAALESKLAELLEASDAAAAHEWAAAARAMSAEATRMSSGAHRAPESGTDAAAIAEHVVDEYLDIVDSTRDEAIALQAQSLAARAIARLAWLRSRASDAAP
jgi:rubrerythrin